MSWNGSDSKRTAPQQVATTGGGKHKVPSRVRGLVALLLVVLSGGLVLWLMHSGESKKSEPEEPSKGPSLIKTDPLKSNVSGKQSKAVATNETKGVASLGPVLGKTPTGKAYVAMTAQTNDSGVVIERYQLTDGSWMRVVQLQTKDSLVFNSAIDSYLAQIFMQPLNERVPPMPPIKNLEKAFEEAIKTPIIVRETDSEKVKAMKKAALEARQQVADLLREGYTVGQVLSEHESLREKNVTFRKEFQNELNEIYRKEGPKAAKDYMESANAKLEKEGIIPLTMPGGGTSKKRNRPE